MAMQKGRDMLLKLLNGAAYETVAGLRARKLSFNAETVDVTDGDSAGRWRELLAGAGIQKATVSGGGLFRDATSDALMRTAFFSGALITAQMVVPDFGIVAGPFQITGLDYQGDHNGELRFDITLESAGPLTFTVI